MWVVILIQVLCDELCFQRKLAEPAELRKPAEFAESVPLQSTSDLLLSPHADVLLVNEKSVHEHMLSPECRVG